MLGKLTLFFILVIGYVGAWAQEMAPADDTVTPATPGDSPADPPAESSADAAEPSEAAPTANNGPQVKTLSGMSILGNEEAPKSLVIVPWKSSEIGDGLDVNDVMNDLARPVDKEVFLREVHYYELRSGGES